MTKTNEIRHNNISVSLKALKKMAAENNWNLSYTEGSHYFRRMQLRTGQQRMGDHPMVWYRHTDKGQLLQTALGHPAELYSDPLFLKYIKGRYYGQAGKNKQKSRARK